MNRSLPAPPVDPPAWVEWIAQDADGAWWGYSVEPLQAQTHWYENEVGECIGLGSGCPNPQWRDTLRRVSVGRSPGQP
jgi:hypothetical protein